MSDVHWRQTENRDVHLQMHLYFPKEALQPIAVHLQLLPKPVIFALLHAAEFILSPPGLVFSPRSSDAVNEGCSWAIRLPETAM